LARSPKASKKSAILERKFRRNLLFVSLSALLIKVFIIFRIQGFDWYDAGNGDLATGLGELLDNNYVPPNAWYGADGENYIRGLQGLVDEGFYSGEGKLSYWPAGYPMLIWPLIEIFRGYFFLALSLFQSIVYALASIWFVDEIRKTRLSRSCYLLAVLLAFNPTLSLNTIAVGYEVSVVSLSLISAAALIRSVVSQDSKLASKQVFIASIAFLFATLMQPRLALMAITFFIVWALAKYRLALVVPFLALTLGLVSISPGILIFRNHQVHGYAAISTNLGVTMRLGAGPEASGGYSNNAYGTVKCPETFGNAAAKDSAVVKCVIDWYLENPRKSLSLFWNKARFFWSPWFGPEANGTMARNPWSQYHPLRSSIQTQDGYTLVYGVAGKTVSWLWMLGGLILLIRGFRYMWGLGDLERLLAIVAGSNFLINLFSAMLTIGDHRFRIPSMAMSILLQAAGVASLFYKVRQFQSREKQLITWPVFQTKLSERSGS